MRNTVVVSAHLDDAVFSCFGIVVEATSVVTVLAGIPPPNAIGDWDRATGATDAALRMRTRRREDVNALLETSANAVHLDLLEVQHTDAMHVPPTSLDAICRSLAAHIESADFVYAPMGLGHPEHALVRDAVLALRPDATLYADLPYALDIDPAFELKNAFTSARQQSERVLSLSSHARKLDACHCYRTQIEPLAALHGLFTTNSVLRTEVLWSLPRTRPIERSPSTRPEVPAPSSDDPALSIVALTRGPSVVLARLLHSLERAEGIEHAEMIIGVEDASARDLATAERMVRHWPPSTVKVLSVPKGHPGANRNALVPLARAPITIFLDDDVTVPPHFLRSVRAAFLDDTVDVAGGPNLTPPGSPPFEHLVGDVLASPVGSGFVCHRYGVWREGRATERSLMLCNLAVRTALLGGAPFEPELKCAEENEFLLRLEHRVQMRYMPTLAVYHHRRSTPAAYARQIAKYGFGRGQLLTRASVLPQAPYLVPLAALVALAVVLALRPALALGALSLYASVVLATGVHIARGRRGLAAASLIALTHAAYTIGLVAGLGDTLRLAVSRQPPAEPTAEVARLRTLPRHTPASPAAAKATSELAKID